LEKGAKIMDAEKEKRFRFRARFEAEQALEAQQPQPAPQEEQPSSGLPGYISGPLKFAGNVAQSLSTGPINAVAQAVQDKEGFGPVALQAAKNVVRSTINPFVTGPNPIQSSETSFERAGVSNTPREYKKRIPGWLLQQQARSFSNGMKPEDAKNYEANKFYEFDEKQQGQAADLGMGADILTPTFGAGAIGALAETGAGKTALRVAASPVRATAGNLASKFEAGANRIQQTVLKPRAGDWNSGAKIENIPKYGIQGGVDDVIKGADIKIKDASDKLREAIQSGADEGATVDLDAILDATKAKIKKTGRQDLVSQIDPIFSEFRKWANVAGERSGQAGGKANLLEAQQFKQTVGAHGAWEKTAAGRSSKVQETFQSKAAQQVYLELKDAIEAAAPEGVKELNKTLSDLIPIRNAAVYRKVVADRNNPIGLGDMLSAMTAIGNGPAGAAMFGASKFTTKGFGAKTMYSIAKTLKGLSESKSAAEAKFYLAKLEKEKMDKAEIAEYLTEMRRPLDLNPPSPPRRVPQSLSRRPLELTFGPEAAPAKKKFDPLDLLVGEPGKGGSGLPGLEGMAPSELATRKAAEEAAYREALIRQSRQPRFSDNPQQSGGVQVIDRSDVSIRPRKPKGYIQSNFPPVYTEDPRFAQVLDNVPERRKLLPTTKGDLKMETLYHGSYSGNIGNDVGMMQLSADPEVAKQYAGKSGSAWSVTPNKNTKIIDMSNKETERIGFDMYKDYQNGTLDIARELENALGKAELSVEDFKKIAKGFNPAEIVNSAEMWDNPNAVQWFINKYNVDYVKTKNGAIVLDPSKVDKTPLKRK
jgi:hypothetical protein